MIKKGICLDPHEWKYSKLSENFAEYNWIMNDKNLGTRQCDTCQLRL